MITSAISSAARLSLAPARLAGRMAGSLLRELRGNDSGHTSSARSSARTTSAPRSRAKRQTKRAATPRSSAKAPPKRTAARARPKSQPSTARSKRTPARARPRSQPSAARPKRTAGPEPLGDVAIAREVESTIFRDVEVHRGQVDVKVAEGVVRLRGNVPTPDLIRELEARAARVPQVRRVENLLRTLDPTPEPATPAAQPAGGAPAPRSGLRGATAEPAPGPPEGALEPAAGRPEGDESADHEPGKAELDKDPAHQPRDRGPRGLHGS
jgi:hypothetical protein